MYKGMQLEVVLIGGNYLVGSHEGSEYEVGIDDVQGISLTPENLNKHGYTYDYRSGRFIVGNKGEELWFIDVSKHIEESKTFDTYEVFLYNLPYGRGYFIGRIKWLHELQLTLRTFRHILN
jgi:hypothetical protein